MEEKKYKKLYSVQLPGQLMRTWGCDRQIHAQKSSEQTKNPLLQGCHAWLSLQSMENADAAIAHGKPECAANAVI